MESSDYSFYNDVAVLKLYASDLGLMAMEPTTMFDLGMGITQPMYQKMDFLLLCIHSSAEGAKSVEGEFDMKSQEYADTMLKALKTGYVAMLRKQGEKLDFSALREMFAQDGSVVSFHDMPLSEEQFTQLTDSVASSVKI
jgi:histidinol phosphatase-like PHP family hydrolase